MNDLEIFEYQERQINKLLQKYRFNFLDSNIKNITNDIVSLIIKISDKHARNKCIKKIDSTVINTSVLYFNVKRFYINYLINQLFRYISPDKKLTILKQIYVVENEDNEIVFDDVNNTLTIENVTYDLQNSTMEQNKEYILIAIAFLYPSNFKYQNEELLTKVLNSNKLSSLNKTRVQDNVFIEIDNIIYPYLIASSFLIKKKWKTKRDDRVRPSHHKIEGDSVPVNDFFIVGGSPALFPRDKSLPPKEKVKCRCYLEFQV